MTAQHVETLPELPEPTGQCAYYSGNVPLRYYTADDMREYARAAIASLAGAQGGCVLVPRKTTREMRIAGAEAAEFWIGGDRWHLQVDGDPDEWPDVEPALELAWAAMLEAATRQPAQVEGEGQ